MIKIIYKNIVKKIKSLSSLALITYLGAVLSFILISKVPYAILFVMANIAIYGVIVYYLMKKIRAKPFEMHFFDEVQPQFLVIFAMMSLGIFYGLHLCYKFYKRPILKDESDDQFKARLISESRQKKLNRLRV